MIASVVNMIPKGWRNLALVPSPRPEPPIILPLLTIFLASPAVLLLLFTMPKDEKTFSTHEILVVSKTLWRYWTLENLIRAGKVTPLNRGSGRERRFSEEEAVKAINLLRPGGKSSLEELEELADG